MTDLFGLFAPVVFAMIGLIIGALAVYFPMLSLIETLIEAKLNDEKFMGNLVANIRPSVVFDHRGSIIANMGALEHLGEIHVKIGENTPYRERIPEQIIISPNKFLSVPPLLESLDVVINTTIERGPKFDIIYNIDAATYVGITPTVYRFRLEVIRPRD